MAGRINNYPENIKHAPEFCVTIARHRLLSKNEVISFKKNNTDLHSNM